MKRIYILVIVLLFCCIIKVEAVQINYYTSGQEGTSSTTCSTGNCISTAGYTVGSYNFTNSSIYGVRVTLVSNTGVKVPNTFPINFWATESMKNAVTGGIKLSNYSTSDGKMTGTNIYEEDVNLWYNGELASLSDNGKTYSDYIKSLREKEVKGYLEHFYEDIKSNNNALAASIFNNISDYYLKFEPIYVVKFLCSDCPGKPVYFIGGTSKEILQFGINNLPDNVNDRYSSAAYYFKFIVRYKDFAKNESFYDQGEGNQWNVIKNYILSTYITDKPIGSSITPYTPSNTKDYCLSISDFINKGNAGTEDINNAILTGNCGASSGLGVGYLRISDFIDKLNPCEYELKNLGNNPTPSQLITLYDKYKTDNFIPNGLLNFKSPSCTHINCNVNNNVEISSCLNASSSSMNFDENNLSCFDTFLTNVPNYSSYGFCKKMFKLTNNLNNTSKFYGFSGQFLIKKIPNYLEIYDNNYNKIQFATDSLANAEVKEVCYLLNGNQKTNDTANVDGDVKVYFGDNNLDNNPDELLQERTKLNIQPVDMGNGLTKFESGYNYKYNLNLVYIEPLTGVMSNESFKYNKTNEGLIIPFNKTSGKIPFKLEYENKTIVNNDICEYTTKQKIISYPSSDTGKLNLEFRTVDTKVPFVRDTNTNWCYVKVASESYRVATSCDSNNSTVIKYIKNRTNSYGYKDGVKQEPIYKIELRPEDIKLIREYNKENQYNDYKVVEYDEKGIKIIENAFLYSLRQGVLKTYKDNNIEKEARNYGTLTNKLIKK